jgi:hypothetical protein
MADDEHERHRAGRDGDEAVRARAPSVQWTVTGIEALPATSTVCTVTVWWPAAKSPRSMD